MWVNPLDHPHTGLIVNAVVFLYIEVFVARDGFYALFPPQLLLNIHYSCFI